MRLNNGNIKSEQSRLSQRIILRYIMTVIIFSAVVILGIILCRTIFRYKIWYDYETEWKILHWLNVNRFPLTAALLSSGWALISVWYIRKLLNYLNVIISESKKLAVPDSEPIKLQPDLSDVQNELNLIREKAIKYAYAAKEAEQRKNDLIVYLAHDLKTPLTSVIGYLSLICDEPDMPVSSKEKYTNIAREKAERLEELINEFFDITRFNLTNISLETGSVNFSRMIHQTAFEFNPVLRNKNLDWDMDIEENVQLICDADKMERVLDNLIKNAVYYSYPDSVIKLKLIKSIETVVFSIENKGKTISEDKLKRIFEQFFRLDSSRGTETGGSGLGLAIAKEITELHGGRIFAESHDEIIKFTVELPL